MDLDALGVCLATAACVVTQTTSGLIVGMLLFLVAAGLTLIFGVLKVVNFAHGTFYMLGGYVAFTTLAVTSSYTLAVLAAAAAMALFGVLFAVVFAVGGALAGLAGALAAPVRSLSPGMGFSILIESFIVTVIGGMGSIAGALVAALLVGLLRGFGTIGFPNFTDGMIYAAM